MLELNISSLLLFDTVLTTFIPGKISSEKRCRSYGPLKNLGRFTVFISSGLQLHAFVNCEIGEDGGRWGKIGKMGEYGGRWEKIG